MSELLLYSWSTSIFTPNKRYLPILLSYLIKTDKARSKSDVGVVSISTQKVSKPITEAIRPGLTSYHLQLKIKCPVSLQTLVCREFVFKKLSHMHK